MKALLLAIVVFILIATNPSAEMHRSRVEDVVASCIARDMGGGIKGGLGRLLQLHTVAGAATAAEVRHVNLLVCSIGMIDDTPVSFGVLNCVLVRKDWK